MATKQFIVDGHAYTEEEMLAANAEAPDVCEWVKHARPGDRCPDAMLGCVCVADEAMFWAAADAQIKLYGEQLLGRMIADGARDTSDAEIDRTLSGCVCGPMLVVLAKEMRRRGLLVLARKQTLREVLTQQWVTWIANDPLVSDGDNSILDWPADSECARAILKVIAEADALAQVWPDVTEGVAALAVQQISILAWG